MQENQSELAVKPKKEYKKQLLNKTFLINEFRKVGARRVNDEALSEVNLVVEEIIKEIIGKSYQASIHAKRKTVTKEDIIFATK